MTRPKMFIQWLTIDIELYVILDPNTLDPTMKTSSLLMYFIKILDNPTYFL